jgi:hypothetical protein
VTSTAVPSVASDTYEAPEHGWTCFHCGEHFASDFAGQQAARFHFGFTIDAEPGCQLKLTSEERSLLKRLRAYEQENARLQREISDEDTPLHRRIAQLECEHAVALRRAEEDGYGRAVAFYHQRLITFLRRFQHLRVVIDAEQPQLGDRDIMDLVDGTMVNVGWARNDELGERFSQTFRVARALLQELDR